MIRRRHATCIRRSVPKASEFEFRRTVAGEEIDGKAILAFAPEGLRCSIEAPFTEKLGARI
jgi:hypothetical protein